MSLWSGFCIEVCLFNLLSRAEKHRLQSCQVGHSLSAGPGGWKRLVTTIWMRQSHLKAQFKTKDLYLQLLFSPSMNFFLHFSHEATWFVTVLPSDSTWWLFLFMHYSSLTDSSCLLSSAVSCHCCWLLLWFGRSNRPAGPHDVER